MGATTLVSWFSRNGILKAMSLTPPARVRFLLAIAMTEAPDFNLEGRPTGKAAPANICPDADQEVRGSRRSRRASV